MTDKDCAEPATLGVWYIDIQTSGGGGGTRGRWVATATRTNEKSEVKTVSFAEDVDATNWDDMQLRAAIEILGYLAYRDPGAECELVSDGTYLQEAVERHTARVENGGVALSGRPLRNWRRLCALFDLSQKLKIMFAPRVDGPASPLQDDLE